MVQPVKKKAIVVASFGTTYQAALIKNIESTERRIQAAFPDYPVFRAFTSRTVIRRIAERDGVQIENESQVLERLCSEGYGEVFVQPLHIVAGAEYEKMKSLVVHCAHRVYKAFARIGLGRPLLFYTGQEGAPDDYFTAIAALKMHLPEIQADTALVLMGHGGQHPANTAYAALQLKLRQAGMERTFVYTVEGFPALTDIVKELQEQKLRKVILAPFMLVAGDHALNDMAGDEADSARSILLSAGFEVDVLLYGLGEIPAIQDIYVQHLRDAMEASTHGLKQHTHG